jgi:hypothetical protein
MHFYKLLNLSKCSLNLIEIPKLVGSMIFSDVFEYCVKYYNMIPIAIYKRHTDENLDEVAINIKENKPDGLAGGFNDEKSKRKSYVWLHPPRKVELSIYDQLFVLSEKNDREELHEGKDKKESEKTSSDAINSKNDGKKV